jgi:hypothetical protein
METYFREVDINSTEATYGEYFKRAMQEDPRVMNSILLDDIKFRADSFQNVVASVEGTQGSGKSLGFIYFGLLLGKFFGYPFTLKNIIFDPDDLDTALEKAPHRTTWLMDEQKRANVGMMSRTTQLNLTDLEEQLRRSQVNLLYASPSLRQHEHFFAFKTFRIIRISDADCGECEEYKQWKPSTGQPSPCDTCDLPTDKRNGYPKYFLLLLQTKRLLDNMLVPRGIIQFPMPNKKFVEEYDIIKLQHIKRLQAKESAWWDKMKAYSDQIWDRKKELLIKKLKNGNSQVVGKETIKVAILNTIGRKLTNEATDTLTELVKQQAEDYILKTGLTTGEE